jgi:hypothetical protein
MIWKQKKAITTEYTTKVEDRTVRWFIESMIQLNVECYKDLDLAKIVVLGMVNQIQQEKKYRNIFHSNNNQLTICKEVVHTFVCKCVGDPSPHFLDLVPAYWMYSADTRYLEA